MGRPHRGVPLAARDVPDRLLIPESLYGRAREVATLVDAFERVVREGRQALVLVSGYSGAGKSSVVNELQQVIVRGRGLLASGKFEPHERDTPLAPIVRAFRDQLNNLDRPHFGGDRRTPKDRSVEPHTSTNQYLIGCSSHQSCS